MTSNGSTPTTLSSDKNSASSDGIRAGSGRVFKAIKRLAIVFGVVLLLIGAYLYFYAARRQAYLTGRNLRALSSLSTQVGTALQSADQIFRQIADTTLDSGSPEWDSAAQFIPLYRHMVLRPKGDSGFVGDRSGACALLKPKVSGNPEQGWQQDPDNHPYCFYRGFQVADSGQTKPKRALAIINMAEYLEPILPRSVFDKTLLANDSGQVLLQSGLPEVPVTNLQSILSRAKADSSVRWNDLRLQPSIADVRLAGKSYRLFLEPCCSTSDGSYGNRRLLLAGLVTRDVLTRESLKVSLSAVMICCGILFLVFLSWPFLKLRLIGEREPVLLRDGLLLGAGSLLAVAMSTIFALDLYSYGKFRGDRDEELQALAGEINTNLRHEIDAAYRQLDTLVTAGLASVEKSPPPDSLIQIRKDSLDFPFFESWSLLDQKGMQVVKWSTDAYIQRRIGVKDRAYFSQVVDGLGWPGRNKPYYLEPTVSRTTGKRQVALSIGLNDEALPVATIALEMVSLIGVVLPPGYGFAVVDSGGKVLLHSDPSRNLDERFLDETDQNRELISAMSARIADTLNLKYGGADYRAYVTPVPGLPWTLVTFLDKQAGRVTNAEWLGTSTYLTLIYSLLLGTFVGLTLLVSPRYRAPWVWPDRRLRPAYLRLIAVNSLYLVALGIAVIRLSADDLLVAGFVLPLQAIAAAWACLVNHRHVPQWGSALARGTVALLLFVVLVPPLVLSSGRQAATWLILLLAGTGSCLALSKRPWLRTFNDKEPQPEPRPIEGAYVAAAMLFLLVTGVMPATAFFKAARAAHTEMLVKRGQLRLAALMEDRLERVRHDYSDVLGAGKSAAQPRRVCLRDTTRTGKDLCELDLYYRFYHGTQIVSPGDTAVPASRVAESDLVQSFLVPYRPQTSVEWRGMLPQTAEDSTWSWLPGNDRLEFRGSAFSGRPTVGLRSVLPAFWPQRQTEEVTAILLGLAVLILTFGIARFLARRFFLIDVTDPVLVSRVRRIASLGGNNLLVVCPNGFEQRQIQPPVKGLVLDLSREKFLEHRDRRSLLAKVGEREPVVLRHFEFKHHDMKTTEAKLALMDAIVSECGSSVILVAEEGLDGAPLGLREAWRLASLSNPGSQRKATNDGLVSLMESLVLVDVARWEDGWKEGDRRVNQSSRHSTAALTLIESESRCDSHLDRIWKGIEQALSLIPRGRAEPTTEEVLDVLGERADPYYRSIWESCRPAERVVLVHLAHHGLVNDKDRRVLRRLLTRGLIRRRPHFTIMNETFRRFLVSRAAEIQPDVPTGAESPWDSARRPVLAIVASLAILLFVTQQELFSATSAIITALATGVASFSRISGFFDSRRTASSATTQ